MASERKPMMAANWKLNKTVREAEAYVAKLLPRVADHTDEVDVAIFAPFTALPTVGRMAEDSAVIAGAQNVYFEDSGAYTGEVSAPMLKDVGADAVIVGHSERREIFGETDEIVARKAARALGAGLIPVVCVGETKEERDADGMWDKVSGQIRAVMEALDSPSGDAIVFAYEPIWAIGTGETASPEDAQEAIGKIRGLLGELGGDEFARSVRIIYGGSIKPGNAADIMAQEDVDGGLVGGASLEADSFAELVEAAHNSVAGDEDDARERVVE
ncbi:MAG: Triosephosphate isomerase [uncultured Rubrobacteraceae bacterium]|uniref:Triosephosphate isomerase n=1 Tax=uncultured Rubrobacteraceae bacterium TaxID=349277 RepID=A0A6J4R668_9ACTN|nr:MAG: Triosephosphate isomerase [uncultured Rubrobacteraceae bacterium]